MRLGTRLSNSILLASARFCISFSTCFRLRMDHTKIYDAILPQLKNHKIDHFFGKINQRFQIIYNGTRRLTDLVINSINLDSFLYELGKLRYLRGPKIGQIRRACPQGQGQDPFLGNLLKIERLQILTKLLRQGLKKAFFQMVFLILTFEHFSTGKPGLLALR